MKWRIFYRDGTTFDDQVGDAEDAPLDGVLVVMEYHKDSTRTMHQGADYYVWLGESWAHGNQRDLDIWVRSGDVLPGRVKFGAWANTTEYQAIVDRAMEDCDAC